MNINAFLTYPKQTHFLKKCKQTCSLDILGHFTSVTRFSSRVTALMFDIELTQSKYNVPRKYLTGHLGAGQKFTDVRG